MKKGGQSIYLFFLLSCIYTIINMEWLNNMPLILLYSIIEGYITAFIFSYFLIPLFTYTYRHFSKAHRYNTSINKFVFPRLQIFPDFTRITNMNRARKAASGFIEAQGTDSNLAGFDNSTYPMLIIDMQGHCIASNTAAQMQYGYTKMEMQMLPMATLYSAVPAQAGEGNDMLSYHKRKSGETFCVDSHFMNITFNEQAAQLAIFIDAKEKMHIESKNVPHPQLAY